MSYTCLLIVLYECACANHISKANFNLINRTDLFICLHIMFLISFRNSKGQKVIPSFWVFGQNFCSVYVSGSGSITSVGRESKFVCCCLFVIMCFCSERFPLSLGTRDGLRYFIVALPEPSI